MGEITLRFTAGAKTAGKTSADERYGFGLAGNGASDNKQPFATRHPPILFLKNGAPKGLLCGFYSDNDSDKAVTVWVSAAVNFADFGYGQEHTLVIGTDVPDRFSIEVRTTTGTLVCLLKEADFDASSGAISYDLIEDLVGSDNITSVNFDASSGTYAADGNTQLANGTVYDITFRGDFDDVNIVDWRALLAGRMDWDAAQSVSSMIPGQESTLNYPGLMQSNNANWAASDFTDYDGYVADDANVGAVGEGGTFDASGNGYYLRHQRVLNEDDSQNSADATFYNSGSPIGHAWEVWAQNARGIDVDRYIWVNGNIDTGGDEVFRDGTSYFTGYASIDDIPGADLTHNALVYVVAGTTVNGSALAQNTIFSVNDGVVTTASSGGGGASPEFISGNFIS